MISSDPYKDALNDIVNQLGKGPRRANRS
jgi:hypothetical protein